MAMARNCYVFAFLTIWGLLCVSALEEDGNSLVVGDVEAKVVGDEQILRLPSEKESRRQAIPWEQSPIQIHSLRFPRRPMVGEEKEMEMEHLPNFGPGRLRPVRFRFGRPGGCHGRFRQSLMPREDPSQPQFLRRMGMGHHRHAHPYLLPAIEDHEKTAFHAHLKAEREGMGFEMQSGQRERKFEDHEKTAFHAHLKPEREGMGFEMQSGQRERKFEEGFGEREEEERAAAWTAWLRSMFH